MKKNDRIRIIETYEGEEYPAIIERMDNGFRMTDGDGGFLFFADDEIGPDGFLRRTNVTSYKKIGKMK